MAEYNNIRKLIKNIFKQCKELIAEQGFLYFINLVALHSIIMLSILLIYQWIETNINIFDFSLPMIMLRLALFGLFLGLWIGYFKILFNYIDLQKFFLSNVIKKYYLLPQILLLKLISYLTIVPLSMFILYKFPYDIDEYGTNIQQFLMDITNALSSTYTDEISWKIYSSYLNNWDILIIAMLTILPIWYSIRFWCAELLIIDREMNIKNSLITSYTLTSKIMELLILGFLLTFLNLCFIILGYIFFIIGLTLSYIIMFLYYRHLKSSMLNHNLNK
tara:strand:- start:118 stop:945 length:828 start_codon:yes stop_codon:yes gene_type:complete